MRSVVVVLPASMCAMIPMFRMRRTSSSADKGAASAAPCPWPSRKSAESRLALNALASAFLIVGPRGNSSNGALRLWNTLLRPRESSSAIVGLLLVASRSRPSNATTTNAAAGRLPHAKKTRGDSIPIQTRLHNSIKQFCNRFSIDAHFVRLQSTFNFQAVGFVGLWKAACLYS